MPLFLFYFQDNETSLYVACQKGHLDVVQTLLGAGAGVNISRSKVSDVLIYLAVVSDSNMYSDDMMIK